MGIIGFRVQGSMIMALHGYDKGYKGAIRELGSKDPTI